MTDDRALLDRFLEGDRRAFDQLMRAHEDRVFGICLRMLRDREWALDATQETFLTVFRKADRFGGRSAFSTWLHRVTVNTCYDQLRRRKRRETLPWPDDHDPADPASGDPFEAADLRPELVDLLQGLPEEFRAAVVLSDVEGLGLQEVADILEVPVGTVKSRLFRARRILSDRLGNPDAPSEPPKGETHA